jgi:AcrR family transcriptional regulator
MAWQPIWMRAPAASGTGRPAEWSRAQITDAAITVAAADGLPAVTMRRVATELGAGAASLYRHLDTRDDLLDLMIDRALRDHAPGPDTGDWRADLVADYLGLLRFLRERPWLVDALTRRPGLGPEAVRLFEHSLGRISSDPAPATAKLEALGVLNGLVRTHALHELQGGVLRAEFVAAQAAFLQRSAADGGHPHLAATLAEVAAEPVEPQDDRFGRILTLVLDGLLPRT